MTIDEQIFFCGNVTLAARKLGISLKKEVKDGVFVFNFVDHMATVNIKGAPADNAQTALVNACETLVRYLDAKSP